MSEVSEEKENMEAVNANVQLGKRVREIVLDADENSNASIWQQCSALFSVESAKVISSRKKQQATTNKRKRATAATTAVTTKAKAKAAPQKKRQRKQSAKDKEAAEVDEIERDLADMRETMSLPRLSQRA